MNLPWTVPALAAFLALGFTGQQMAAAEGSIPAINSPPWPPPNSGRLQVVAPVATEVGTAETSIGLIYRDLPAGSGVAFHLVRAEGPAASSRYSGPTGPLADEPLQLFGSGRTALTWDGATVACAPGDIRQRCGVEPGRYRIQTTLHAHGKFRTLPALLAPPPPPVLEESYSEPFTVTGPPDWARLGRELRGAASRHVADQPLAQGFWATLRRDWFVSDALGPLRREAGGWCMEFAPRPPIEGRLKACAPRSVISDAGLQVRGVTYSFEGHLTWPATIIQGSEAWDAALALVPDAEALGFVGWAPSARGKQRSIYAAQYRPDLRAWLIRVNRTPPAGSKPSIADAIVIVKDNGAACVADRRRGGEAMRTPDLEATIFRCPGR